MKKYILMLAVAACGLVACNNANEEKKDEAKAGEQTEATAENNGEATVNECEATPCEEGEEATEGEATEGEATEGEAEVVVAEEAVAEN